MYPFILICNLPIDVVRHMTTGSMLKMLHVDLNSKFAKHLCHLPVYLYFVLVESLSKQTLTRYGKIRKMILIVIIPPLPEGERGGVYCFTSVRPSKIFFVAFFSVTVEGRNLIFCHKHHIGIPYCG